MGVFIRWGAHYGSYPFDEAPTSARGNDARINDEGCLCKPVFESIVRVLTAGIAGSQVTPLRLLVVLVLLAALMWVTRRATRWFVEHVLAKRGVDVGLREALGTHPALRTPRTWRPGDPASAPAST